MFMLRLVSVELDSLGSVTHERSRVTGLGLGQLGRRSGSLDGWLVGRRRPFGRKR